METLDVYKTLYKIDALVTVLVWVLIVVRAHLQVRYDRLTGEDTFVFPGLCIVLAVIPIIDITVLVYVLVDIAVIRKDISTHYFRLFLEAELDGKSRTKPKEDLE